LFQKEDRALEVIAQSAITAGRQDDAIGYLVQLANIARDRGSWGDGWRSNAKQRYHKISVALRGEPARRAAFDAFVDDLKNRRESVEYILPDIGSILDLLSPKLSWAETWSHLQLHLVEFREYRIGSDPEVTDDGVDGEDTLADVLFRAFETTSAPLMTMARTAAIELVGTPSGTDVIRALIARLWRAGGNLALEASQIAWECREADAVQKSVEPLLQQMADSQDIAVCRVAHTLGNFWNKSLKTKQRELPTIYSLEMPPDPQAERFDPPSGMTAISSGLYTEDIYAWTWMLGTALRYTAKGSGLPLVTLRRRVGQTMSQTGGTTAFGPPAIEQQQKRLRRLKIHTPYRKLPNAAALQSMREVVGELASADAVDPGAIQHILRHAGGFSSGVPTLPPTHRAVGVSAPKLPDSFHSKEVEDWLNKSESDAVKPLFENYVVLAATARHSRRRFRDALFVEQYYGPIAAGQEESLSLQLQQLPQVVIGDQTIPLYKESAPGAELSPNFGDGRAG
jgi:hypothetical protein